MSGKAGAVLILLFGLHAGAAGAQVVASTPASPPRDSLSKADAAEAVDAAQDEILVTAHRQRGAVATNVPPEVSINAKTIEALGAADLDEVFRQLAPEIGGESAGQGTPIVLVNGQRIAGFSSIKSFPPETIRRIEVFPEQVALQYGYGPGQRVVNLVLRTNYRALTLLGRYTIAPDNWRGLYRAKLDLIRIGEDSHWNLALDYSHQDSIFADSTLTAVPAAPGGIPPGHTLAAQDDHFTASGTTTRKIGDVSAELAASIDLDVKQSRPGLSNQDGGLLAQEGLSDLISGPFNRIDRTVDAQTNLTLNGKLSSWRWSFIGKLDDTTRETTTGSNFNAGGLETLLLPSPTLLGHRCVTGDADCVSTDSRQASGDLYLNGDLFSLPAGAVTAALRTGFIFSGIRSVSSLAPQSTDLSRSEGNGQVNLDFPITAHDSAVGKLSVGINGGLRQLSDFGTLSTVGSTLDWAPVKAIDILASFSRVEDAPSLFQLGEATLATPDLRAYDFVSGTTTIAQLVQGGNEGLARPISRIGRLRLQVSPVVPANLVLSAEYTIERIRNPIVNITAATLATMAAFPDRFTRENGFLTSIDTSPVNLASRDRQQLRWGLTYATAFGTPPPAGPSGKPPFRNQFQIALYDSWRLQDDVVLRNGLPGLNLLGEDTISNGGGTPTHQVDLQTTISTEPWSVDISAVWQTPTTAKAGPMGQDQLTFSQGVTLNLRLQINLADQHWLTRRIPWLRGNLNLSFDNLLGASMKVHDAEGMVPAAYSADYLNPTGRTFRVTLRKRF